MQQLTKSADHTTALLTIGTGLALVQLLSRPVSPTPAHPRTFAWYTALRKPSAKPPDPVFGAIWPVLMSLMSAGTYRLLTKPANDTTRSAVAWWATSLALVAGYGLVTFGRRSLSGGVVVGAALVGSTTAFVRQASRSDRWAALLGLPVLLWSAFGTLLTISLAARNPELDGRDPGLIRRITTRLGH